MFDLAITGVILIYLLGILVTITLLKRSEIKRKGAVQPIDIEDTPYGLAFIWPCIVAAAIPIGLVSLLAFGIIKGVDNASDYLAQATTDPARLKK